MTKEVIQEVSVHPRFPVPWKDVPQEQLSEKKWISLHIFYSSNQNPLILELIDPMVNQLREQGLIRRYFFIKYWMEGPHVRLRLLPTDGVKEEQVKAFMEPMVGAYLKRRPALYEIDAGQYKDFHKQMFIAEYGEPTWTEKYGETGEMPLRANNSYHYIPYEPEYDRYGGVYGIEVAEWHFEKSSDVVIQLLHNANLRIRNILLGLSIQFTLPLCYRFMPQEKTLVEFFTNYSRYWEETFSPQSKNLYPEYEKRYLHAAPELQRRIKEIRGYMVEEAPGSLTSIEREWISHIRELRHKLDELIVAGKLVFRGKGEEGERGPITKKDINYYQILLSSYIHMLNNRLGVSISDEIYLAYLMRRAAEDLIAIQDGMK